MLVGAVGIDRLDATDETPGALVVVSAPPALAPVLAPALALAVGIALATRTDECAGYTGSVLWFNECVLMKTCTRCHNKTSSVSTDMVEDDEEHKFWFRWDRDERSKAANGSVLLTFLLRNFHDGVVGKMRRCSEHVAVESASQKGQSVQQLCRNQSACYQLQLSEAGLGKFVVIRCDNTKLSLKELTPAAQVPSV